jgi:DNA repair protein RecO (recombination protein O)
MEIRKTTGIVLAASHCGEADLLCTVLTRDYGKGRFVFKGLRKSRRRSHAAAEPGSVTSLQYYHRDERESSIVKESSVNRHFPQIRKDLEKIYHLAILLETCDRTTAPDNSGVLLYGYLLAALERLASTPSPAHLTAVFLLHLLKINGLLHVNRACGVCGRSGYASFTLDRSDLKTRCDRCGDGHRLPSPIMEFIEQALSVKFADIQTALYGRGPVLDLIYQLLLFIEGYYHVQIKSKDFIFYD